jgi:hypothetical protein
MPQYGEPALVVLGVTLTAVVRTDGVVTVGLDAA